MSIKRRKTRKPSLFNKQVLEAIDDYCRETGTTEYDAIDVARWAEQNGRIELQPLDIIKRLAKVISRASQQDYLTDKNGEPVRHRHCYREKRGDKQLTFWFKMENATPEKMRLSVQIRLNGPRMDVLQIDRDLSYFNENYNPGDPIEADYNFNPFVAERHLPTEYPDVRPEGEDDEEEPPEEPSLCPTA